ncbi:hypothetical protein NKH77_38115 [Streptomyces sp. M19]
MTTTDTDDEAAAQALALDGGGERRAAGAGRRARLRGPPSPVGLAARPVSPSGTAHIAGAPLDTARRSAPRTRPFGFLSAAASGYSAHRARSMGHRARRWPRRRHHR